MSITIESSWENTRLKEEIESLCERKSVAWFRPRSDGGYEGPIMDSAIEDIRKKSGAWVPLYRAAEVTK